MLVSMPWNVQLAACGLVGANPWKRARARAQDGRIGPAPGSAGRRRRESLAGTPAITGPTVSVEIAQPSRARMPGIQLRFCACPLGGSKSGPYSCAYAPKRN